MVLAVSLITLFCRKFVVDEPGDSVTCKHLSQTCLLDVNYAIFGCCSTSSSCPLPTSCLPASLIASCDSACAVDPNIIRWWVTSTYYIMLPPLTISSASTSPYCNQYVLSTRNALGTAWYCGESPLTQTVVLTAGDGTKPVGDVYTTPMSIQRNSASSLASTTPLIIATSPTGSISGSFPFSTAYAPAATPDSSSKPAPIGAIIGGVLGGVFIIGALAIGFMFFSRTRNTSNQVQVAMPVAFSPGHASEYYVRPGKEVYAPQ